MICIDNENPLDSFELWDESVSLCLLKWHSPVLVSLPNIYFACPKILQKINLGFHFDVEQRARSYLGWFFNFNGTAGVWRIEVRSCKHLNWDLIHTGQFEAMSPLQKDR